jgi:hypothetical protein
MLADRIIGAFTFKKGLYKEVANDTSFTSSAWLIVLVISILSQLGQRAATIHRSFFGWLIGSIILGAVGVGAFAVAAYVLALVAKSMFNARVEFEQVVRALGLAYVWRVIGFIGIVAVIGTLLNCLLTPVTVLAGLAGLVASLLAIKESTGMDWAGTVVAVIIAFVIDLIILVVAAIPLFALGLLVR